MSVQDFLLPLLAILNIAAGQETTNLRGSGVTTAVVIHSTDDGAYVENSSSVPDTNITNMSLEASGTWRECCGHCGNGRFFSPISGRCYANKAKDYYQTCSPQAHPSRPSCCSHCGDSSFCSPNSGRCYTNKAKDYYQTCSPHMSPQQPAPPQQGPSCLCIFDMDRTLTGVQSDLGNCPDNKVISGQSDNAYGGGTLTLSQLGQHLRSTFCGGCHLAGITAHPTRRPYLEALVHDRVVRGCDTSCKAREAANMANRLSIPQSEVFMFDDKADNIRPFQGTGMNAHQISCNSRSGSTGLCGGKPGEVKKQYGVGTC